MRMNIIEGLIALSMGSVICAACSEKISPAPEVEQEKVTFSVSVPTSQTKVTGSVDETTIVSYQVFVYNASGELEAYASKGTSDITVECTVGTKTVVVVANAPKIETGATYDQLLACRSSLGDNGSGNFVMVGKVTPVITSSTTSISVPVARLVSKVRLSKLETAFEMPQYQAMAFKVSAVYLINVPADRNYLSAGSVTQWYNKMKYVSSDINTLIYDNMNDVAVSSSSPYAKTNTFYCYSNMQSQDSFSTTWSARHTRLVVEAKLGDNLYYYPVTLPVLESNKIYDVSLTVTRPGSTVPDHEVDKSAVGFTVSVRNWETGASVTEEI